MLLFIDPEKAWGDHLISAGGARRPVPYLDPRESKRSRINKLLAMGLDLEIAKRMVLQGSVISP